MNNVEWSFRVWIGTKKSFLQKFKQRLKIEKKEKFWARRIPHFECNSTTPVDWLIDWSVNTWVQKSIFGFKKVRQPKRCTFMRHSGLRGRTDRPFPSPSNHRSNHPTVRGRPCRSGLKKIGRRIRRWWIIRHQIILLLLAILILILFPIIPRLTRSTVLAAFAGASPVDQLHNRFPSGGGRHGRRRGVLRRETQREILWVQLLLLLNCLSGNAVKRGNGGNFAQARRALVLIRLVVVGVGLVVGAASARSGGALAAGPSAAGWCERRHQLEEQKRTPWKAINQSINPSIDQKLLLSSINQPDSCLFMHSITDGRSLLLQQIHPRRFLRNRMRPNRLGDRRDCINCQFRMTGRVHFPQLPIQMQQ